MANFNKLKEIVSYYGYTFEIMETNEIELELNLKACATAEELDYQIKADKDNPANDDRLFAITSTIMKDAKNVTPAWTLLDLYYYPQYKAIEGTGSSITKAPAGATITEKRKKGFGQCNMQHNDIISHVFSDPIIMQPEKLADRIGTITFNYLLTSAQDEFIRVIMTVQTLRMLEAHELG